MHYGSDRLTAFVAYVTTLTYASTMTSGLALLAHWSARRKLNLVSSVQFSCVALYAPLVQKCLQSIIR